MRSYAAIARAKAKRNATGKPLEAAKRRRKGMRLAVVTAQHLAREAEKIMREFKS